MVVRPDLVSTPLKFLRETYSFFVSLKELGDATSELRLIWCQNPARLNRCDDILNLAAIVLFEHLRIVVRLFIHLGEIGRVELHGRRERADRKSTRLNSSHHS